MTTYGVYFEFNTKISREAQVHALVSRAIGANFDCTQLSIEQLWAEPVKLAEQQLPLGMSHDFFDGIPSIGEGDPNDVFQYPHIKQLLDHLGMKDEDNGSR